MRAIAKRHHCVITHYMYIDAYMAVSLERPSKAHLGVAALAQRALKAASPEQRHHPMPKLHVPGVFVMVDVDCCRFRMLGMQPLSQALACMMLINYLLPRWSPYTLQYCVASLLYNFEQLR
jgi:hypothetical protein